MVPPPPPGPGRFHFVVKSSKSERERKRDDRCLNPGRPNCNLIAAVGQKTRRIFEIIIHRKSDGARRTKGVFARESRRRRGRKGERKRGAVERSNVLKLLLLLLLVITESRENARPRERPGMLK